MEKSFYNDANQRQNHLLGTNALREYLKFLFDQFCRLYQESKLLVIGATGVLDNAMFSL